MHLRINLIWATFTRPFEFKREFSHKLLAQGMARERWRGQLDWSQMRLRMFYYEVTFFFLSYQMYFEILVSQLWMGSTSGVLCSELIKTVVWTLKKKFICAVFVKGVGDKTMLRHCAGKFDTSMGEESHLTSDLC